MNTKMMTNTATPHECLILRTVMLWNRPFMILTSTSGSGEGETVISTGWDATTSELLARAGLPLHSPVDAREEESDATRAVKAFERGNLGAVDTIHTTQQGTELQKSVWEHLRSIPAGTRQTYSEVAKSAGSPRAIRAVASACGKNANALFVPCHRVVASNGSLAGFAWGLDVKEELLKHESKYRNNE